MVGDDDLLGSLAGDEPALNVDIVEVCREADLLKLEASLGGGVDESAGREAIGEEVELAIGPLGNLGIGRLWSVEWGWVPTMFLSNWSVV